MPEKQDFDCDQDFSRLAARAGNCVLLTGCSGGGKSCLLAELSARGFSTCEEPGRRIVREVVAKGGDALPWTNLAKFAERAARLGLADLRRAASCDGVTIFDRGLIDAVCAMERLRHPLPADIARAFAAVRYAPTVFLAPPWPEIFETDRERKHGFEDAVAEYEYLAQRLPALGYAVMPLPKVSIAERADFVVATLNAPPPARR